MRNPVAPKAADDIPVKCGQCQTVIGKIPKAGGILFFSQGKLCDHIRVEADGTVRIQYSLMADGRNAEQSVTR